jgi:hypothetical protein
MLGGCAEIGTIQLLVASRNRRCGPAHGIGMGTEPTSKQLIGDSMQSRVRKLVMSIVPVVIGIATGAIGIYVGDTDDAPGAALIGILLMIGAVAFGVRTAYRAIRRPA